jgi:hypothetical protein
LQELKEYQSHYLKMKARYYLSLILYTIHARAYLARVSIVSIKSKN